VSHATTSEVLHLFDAHEKAQNNDLVNAGVYFISTQIYQEFDKVHAITLFDVDRLGQDSAAGEG